MSDMEDEGPAVAGKGRGRGKRGRGGSPDEDWEDEDYVDSEEDEGRKRSKKRSGGGRGRGGKAAEPEESEEEDDDESDDEEKLAGMTELERELYLFERDEQRAREREKKQAMQQARKAKEKVEVRASSRRARPATGADSAIGKLAAARQQRERRVARRREEDEAEEAYASEDKEEEEEEAEPSTSERGDDDDAEARRFGARGARGYDEGEGGVDEGDEEDEDQEPADLEAVLKMQLRRNQLEEWYDKPFFDTAVKGCVVRISYGPPVIDPATGQQVPGYMMMRVSDVAERQPYRFTTTPGVKTNKWLVLEESGQTKALQMSVISTKDITPEEFDRYSRHCDRHNQRRITRRDAALGAKQIHDAVNYKFTTDDIKRKLAERREKGEVVGSMMVEKARLRGLLEAAESAGNEEAAVQYRARLEELEAVHAATHRAAFEIKAGIARMNARNKTTNFEKALKNVGNRPDGDAGREGGVDVFSRRQTQSKVYWQTKKKDAAGPTTPERGGAGAAAAAGQQQQQQQQPAAAGGGAAAVAATHKLSRTMSNMDPAELIPLLGIDIDFDALPSNGAGAGAGALSKAATRRMLGGGRWELSEAARKLAAEHAAAPRPVSTLSDWLATTGRAEGM